MLEDLEWVGLEWVVKEADHHSCFGSILHSILLNYHNSPTDCSTCHWSKDYLDRRHYFQQDSSKEPEVVHSSL